MRYRRKCDVRGVAERFLLGDSGVVKRRTPDASELCEPPEVDSSLTEKLPALNFRMLKF